MIGNVVGNYKVVEKIGEGGMGAVYRGVDLMLEREVAIKVLRPELASQPQIVERFRSEAVTLAKLNHPNVATLYSFFRQENEFFMVMEFVRGETLDRFIRARGAMTCEQAVSMFCQVLEGIDHAHRLGIVHRDIKPGNMMLTEMGILKVLDFGIARVLGTSRLTRTGFLLGTVEYMSPEQVRGLDTDARSDIYSLGMLLYEMLTGRVPFKADSEYDLMKAQVEAIPPPPRHFAPHITDTLEQTILRALAKQPADRFQTAGEFRVALLGAGLARAAGPEQRVAGRTQTTRPLPNMAPPIPGTRPPASGEVHTPQSIKSVQETRPSAAADLVSADMQTREMPRGTEPGAPAGPAAEGAVSHQPPPAATTDRLFSAPATTPMVAALPVAARADTPVGNNAPPAVAAAPPPAVKRKVQLPALLVGVALLLLVGGGATALMLWQRAQRPAAEPVVAQQRAAAAPPMSAPSVRPEPATPTPPEGMVYIPGGEYIMGDDTGDEYERPAHRVAVKPFFLDKYEVTNEEYQKFVKEAGHKPPPAWQDGTYPEGTARRPVTGVTWDDANAYAQWAGKRLPTEEEWEFAARGREGRRYPWSMEWQAGMANADNASRGTQDVGATQGASPFGAYDMVGNAWEWTASALSAYPGGQLPKAPAANEKIIRGGCWLSNPQQATTTYRMGWPAQGGSDYDNTGFRCAKDLGAMATQ